MNKYKTQLIVGGIALAVILIIVVMYFNKRKKDRELQMTQTSVFSDVLTPLKPSLPSAEDLRLKGYNSEEIIQIMSSDAYKRGEY
jgi:hypothetical protein